jgi:hypothetical protein
VSQPIERLLQALENVGNSFGGNTGRLLLAIVREYHRLKRYEEDQEHRRIRAKEKEMEKEYKITGVWPGDDDIPF